MATAEQVQEALRPLQAQGHVLPRWRQPSKKGRALIQTPVTTLSKGSRKGKGKRDKDQNHMSNVKCWNYGRSDHYWRDCRAVRWSGDTGGRAGDARSRPLREKPCRVFQEEHGQEAKERGRPMGVPAPEVDVEGSARRSRGRAKREKIGQRQCRVLLLERRASGSERRFE